ncbi:hypothetical protein L6164_007251 [Bauhinia variegata]|uniref:Uncharacterized protein n=1 Tax=Bauhinia variegata TaxID=167791 RepID=A0ACB9PCZ2_BAUVA|nr:hypothetical protein L6164_007251 [Bauhinia variegata]
MATYNKKKMKYRFLMVLLVLGIVSFETESYRYYDYFKLALVWPNSYCLTKVEHCREQLPQYFTLGGLRPEKTNGKEPQYCLPATGNYLSNDTIEKYRAELLRYWPDLSTCDFEESKNMWIEQWRRHGSCSNVTLSPEEYITCALNRREDHNLHRILTNAGIRANGNSYSPNKILEILATVTGALVDIVCEADRFGNVYLVEIHQCINYNGQKFIDCNNMAKNCDDDPIFPRPLFPKRNQDCPKTPPRGRPKAP